MTVSIIGAGIGGLTTAIALQRKGIDTQIYEQSSELKSVGAGIILANNAMQVYEKLGLKQAIEKKGNPISSMNITDTDLAPLSNINLHFFEQKFGCRNIAIHRGQLQEILLRYIDKAKLNLGHKLISIQNENGINRLKFQNGIETQSSIILGADGINSTIRKHIFPKSKIRDAFQICWRGLVDLELPENKRNELNEAWGKGNRFGFVQIAPNKVYWYALKSLHDSEEEHTTQQLSQLFSEYDRLIGEIIQKTEPGNIHTAKINDLKPLKSWYYGGICLLGDAAHATTPNMGQGACQAIEDAYILSECLSKFDIEKAFATFQELRSRKVAQVVSTSWRIGKIAHWKNPLAVGIRNGMLKFTPKNVNRRQSEKIFRLEIL